MNLSLPVIYDEFQEALSYKFNIEDVSLPLASFCRYYPGMVLKSAVLYLVEDKYALINENTENIYLILLSSGINNESIDNSKTLQYENYIEVSRREFPDMTDLAAHIRQLFQMYDEWELRLIQAMSQRQNVDAICRIIQPILRNPVMVHDEEFKVLGFVDSPETPFNYSVLETGTEYMNESAVKDLTLRADFRTALLKHKPHIWLDLDDSTYSMVLNLFQDDVTYIGQFVVDQIQEFRKGLSALMYFIGPYFVETIRYFGTASIDHKEIFKETCIRYLTHPTAEIRHTLIEELASQNWKQHDDYVCIIIHGSKQSVESYLTAYESILLDHHILNSVSLHYRKGWLMIYNLTQSKKNREEMYSEFTTIIRENILYAGVSLVFHDFLRFPEYYKAALAALETGRKNSDTQWIFRFEDVITEHILTNGSDSLPLSVLIPPGLERIIEHDQQYDTEYYKTLRNYLFYDKKTVRAIEDLYVHRNTFSFRMKKIHKMIELNLNNEEVKLYLKIIIHLLDNQISDDLEKRN